MTTEMWKVGIPVLRKIGPLSYCYYPVFWHQDYHLYTGRLPLHSDPYYLYALYGGPFINWPNYLWYNSTAFDTQAGTNLFYAGTTAGAIAGCNAAQLIGWGPGGDVVNIPLWATVAETAQRGYYNPDELLPDEQEGGPYADMIGRRWEGVVNPTAGYITEGCSLGFGKNSWWTFLSLHPQGYSQGGIARYGLPGSIMKLNPLRSETYEEWEILNKAYDTLLKYDPFTRVDIPWMAYNWVVSWWWDSEDVGNEKKTLLIFELDDNIYWHDGVKFTSSDVKFTIEYIRDNLGHSYPKVMEVRDVIRPDDYTVIVRLDVASMWALHWIGELPMIPRHIWEDIEDPTVDMPDPTLTGTGPFDFISYDPDAYVAVFNAFKANVFPNAPIRTLGKPFTYAGIYPTGYSVVTRKTVIAQEYLSTLAIELKVKNCMAGATSTYTPTPWTGTWTVTTPTSTQGIAATLTPCAPATTLIYPPVSMETWTSMSNHLVNASHNNQVNGFPIGSTSISIAKTSRGDVNGDFALNVLDPLHLMAALGMLPYGVFTSSADIQGDGAINILDCLIIVNAFAGSWP